MKTFIPSIFLLALIAIPGTSHARYTGDVAGWVPWWTSAEGIESVTANIKDIDVLYPFIYEVASNGDIVQKADSQSDEWEELLDEAKSEKIDIIPTIAWFDGDEIHDVLSNRNDRKQLVRDIEKLVDNNDYDGINIDFESKNSETIDYFSSFLKELDKALGRDALTCTVEARMRPEHRWRNVPAKISYANDYKAINKYCERIELMTYDQQRADLVFNDLRRGLPYNPVADIDWVEHVLEFALEDFDADKVLLGIPTYGRAYDVTVASEWYKDYKAVASVDHSRAVELSKIYNVPIGRTAGGEAIITYFPDTSPYKIFNQLPTPAGTPKGYEAAAKALLVATIADVEIPVRMLTWGDATAAKDKINLANEYDLGGVVFFKFDGEEDKKIWSQF